MNVRRVSMPAVVLALASACATGLGPKAVPSERPDYNRQIVRSNDAELLLNLVRLRYDDAMLFLGVGGVVAQYAYDATLNAGGQAGGGTGSATFGTSFGYGEKPTITYTPLVGEEAAARLLAPISIQSIMLFQEGGWSADRLLLLTVQRVNDVFNAPTAGGPTPMHAPDYEASPTSPSGWSACERPGSRASIGCRRITKRSRPDASCVSGSTSRPIRGARSRQTSPLSAAPSISSPAATSSRSRNSRTSGSPPRWA